LLHEDYVGRRLQIRRTHVNKGELFQQRAKHPCIWRVDDFLFKIKRFVRQLAWTLFFFLLFLFFFLFFFFFSLFLRRIDLRNKELIRKISRKFSPLSRYKRKYRYGSYPEYLIGLNFERWPRLADNLVERIRVCYFYRSSRMSFNFYVGKPVIRSLKGNGKSQINSWRDRS
jgi:hypothetical protein